jgi:hypothetical protein
MEIVPWIVSGVLAAFNLFAGGGKILTPWENLSAKLPYTETVGKGLTYLAGWAGILGAIGVIVPNILAHIVPGWEWARWVSVAAATGLALVQLLAIVVRLKRKEYNATINAVFAAVAVAAAVLIGLV